jgi:hypothetical protein
MPDAGFVLSGEGTPNGGNGRRAGVAQSVAQLSCKQQVRGSSPLASSKYLVRPAFLFWIPNRPPGNPQLSDPIILVLLQPSVDLGSLPPKMLPDPVSPEAAAFPGAACRSCPEEGPDTHQILDVHKPVIVLGNGPTPWHG